MENQDEDVFKVKIGEDEYPITKELNGCRVLTLDIKAYETDDSKVRREFGAWCFTLKSDLTDDQAFERAMSEIACS